MEDFAVTCALVPGGPTPRIRFLCVAPRIWIELPPDPPRGDALALLLAFGSATTWREDFHLARSVPCLAHTFGSQAAARQRRRPLELGVKQEYLAQMLHSVAPAFNSSSMMRLFFLASADSRLRLKCVSRSFAIPRAVDPLWP